MPADIYKHVCSFHDYYFTSECRDLLFHVQEHEYDLLELRDMLKTLKLNFLSFYLHRDILKKYKARFPGVRDSLNLETWHEFEQSEPDAFKEMYKFLCRKA